ncbi:hypothetical protein FOL01_0394 [Weissella jogaejeotgali]|uniref:Uncharacterized protein n=1 Tax=Weissella jogaejeotgali TaxID=1631871 RepID=A0A1L6R9R9_9LACO|nr:hypothetical protein [Weissella jogaejeotgali]APS41253.1 hypothetical protein FOL01_0394 [Weissella jogaejeotgali]
MPKKKYMTTQQYGMLLSELIETIQEAGDRVAPFFEKLDDVLKNNQLAQLPNEEFVEVATEFENVVEIYQDVSKKLNRVTAPVRFIGAHQMVKQTFMDYTAATKVMADSLDVTSQQVNVADFRQPEADQDVYMDKFLAQIRRIFTTVTA